MGPQRQHAQLDRHLGRVVTTLTFLAPPDGSGLLILAVAHWWIGYCLTPYVRHAR